MLGKLFKYEMKSTARTFIPVFIAVLVLSLINKLLILFTPNNVVFSGFRTLMMTFYIITIVASIAVCLVVTIQRFYKNLLGQEGHLMFTLPVTAGQNILSKAFAAILWMIATVIVVPDYEWLKLLGPQLSNARTQILATAGFDLYWLLALVALVVFLGFIAFTMEVYCAMSFGQLSNSHKLATSFGAYIAMYAAMQIVSGSMMGIYAFSSKGLFEKLMEQSNAGSIAPPPELGQFILTMLIFTVLLNLIYIAVYFFLSRHLLTKKLNLE